MARRRRRRGPWDSRPGYVVMPGHPPGVPPESWFHQLAEARRYAEQTAHRHHCHMTVWLVRWTRRGALDTLVPIEQVPPGQPPGPSGPPAAPPH